MNGLRESLLSNGFPQENCGASNPTDGNWIRTIHSMISFGLWNEKRGKWVHDTGERWSKWSVMGDGAVGGLSPHSFARCNASGAGAADSHGRDAVSWFVTHLKSQQSYSFSEFTCGLWNLYPKETLETNYKYYMIKCVIKSRVPTYYLINCYVL